MFLVFSVDISPSAGSSQWTMTASWTAGRVFFWCCFHIKRLHGELYNPWQLSQMFWGTQPNVNFKITQQVYIRAATNNYSFLWINLMVISLISWFIDILKLLVFWFCFFLYQKLHLFICIQLICKNKYVVKEMFPINIIKKRCKCWYWTYK